MKKNVHDIESMLNSLDGMQRAETKPFFATRVLVRLEKETETKSSWMLVRKPVLVIAVLSFFFAMNIFLIVQQVKQSKMATVGETSSLQSFVNEYHLNSNNNY